MANENDFVEDPKKKIIGIFLFSLIQGILAFLIVTGGYEFLVFIVSILSIDTVNPNRLSVYSTFITLSFLLFFTHFVFSIISLFKH